MRTSGFWGGGGRAERTSEHGLNEQRLRRYIFIICAQRVFYPGEGSAKRRITQTPGGGVGKVQKSADNKDMEKRLSAGGNFVSHGDYRPRN